MLTCLFCSKEFKVRGNLNIHLISHTKEKPYKCPTCSAVFGMPDSLKKHINVVHEGVKIRTRIKERNHKCPKCSYKSSKIDHLACHIRKHSTERPFMCTIPGCEFKTKYERNLPQHVQRMHSDERPHECTAVGCNYKTNSVSNLYRHRKVHSDEKPFFCELPGCNYSCKYVSSLKVHIYRVHSSEQPLKCPICDFRTKYKERLQQHEDEHNTNSKRFQCPAPKCNFSSHRSYGIQLHIGNKHTKKNITCTAPGCNFKCGNTVKLKTHVRTKHLCPILKCPADSCKFSTRLTSDLRLHVASKHKELENAPWLMVQGRTDLQTAGQTRDVDTLVCPFQNCDYQTEFSHRLDRHMKALHEEKRKHVCKFCSHRFSLQSGLERHIQQHLGEKVYSCQHCEFTTTSSGALRCHARSIHKIHIVSCGRGNQNAKKWNCRTCSKSCASYNEFVLHSMTHLNAVVVLERLKLQVL